MRVRTAKQRAQRIELDYFTRAHGLRRWRIGLSIALPVVGLVWIAGAAAAGNRAPYTAGPVSRSHAFAETRCQVCHADASFRRHTTDSACLTCHDAPAHAANQTAPPACSTCHLDHNGRIDLAKVDSRFCVECHGDLKTRHGDPRIATAVRGFPSGHPEFAAVRDGAPRDPGRLKFNHAAHLTDSLTGPDGPEKLECATCHTPEALRSGASPQKPRVSGLMTPVTYQQQCARCHPLFFDERLELQAPHGLPEKVRPFVRQALATYIQQHPNDMTRPDVAVRRVPLNFPRPVEPPARTPEEWVARRAAFDEQLLWSKTCAECHENGAYAQTNITTQWMPRAAFDHAPHAMVTCDSCHRARASTKASDVLLPTEAVCATCHAPSRGADSRCFECHRYHDWTKTHAASSPYTLKDFK